jgi:hypothetical protein
MLDAADSKRPERSFALIAHELSRLKVSIAALSKVHFPDEGYLKESSTSYTLSYSGRHLSGVGLMIRPSIASMLENLPIRHSDCIIPLKNKQYSTLFGVYAPTLQALLLSPKHEKAIILGDFNA